MSPLNPTSLVESSQHSKATLELLKLKIDRNLIDYIVQTTVNTVAYVYDGPSASDSESESRGRSRSRSNKYTSFAEFVSNVITRSEVTVGVLLVALVYIERAKPHLTIETMDWAHERVFLGALILASKYTNDSTLLNIHWSLVTGTFGKGDVGRIEREFLDVLDYELGISESDILDHHDSLIVPRPRSHFRARRASSPVAKRVISPTTSEEHSYWSDSDSDVSSTPSPVTPLTPYTPAHQQLPAKLHSHHEELPSQLFLTSPSLLAAQLSSLPMASEIQIVA